MTNNNPWDAPTQYRAHDASQPAGAAGSGNAGRIIFIVVAVVALLAVTAGFTWVLTSRTSSDDAAQSSEVSFTQAAPSSSTSSVSTKASSAAPEADTVTVAAAPQNADRCGSQADEVRSGIRAPMTLYCDDNWLYLATENSSFYYLYTWGDGAWEVYENDDYYDVSSIKCWNYGRLDADNAPKEILQDIALCTHSDRSEEIAEFRAQQNCDGRYILIVDSLLIPYGESPDSEIARVKAYYDGVSVMSGNTCSSLRSEYEGKQVYAVYYEAGRSVDEVCKLKARHGGNARSLNNDADFSDPC